jgi:hypothetical protein
MVSEKDVSMWYYTSYYNYRLIVITVVVCVRVLPVQAAYHEPLVSAWFEIVSSDYKDSHYISSTDEVSEADARRNAL